MNKKEYIVRQLNRTTSKKYEAYVVHRIVHRLNNSEVKFITQQYISRPEGYALTDLYFPQIGVHIEVDEPRHKAFAAEDSIREIDIVNATNHRILRVDTSQSIDKIDEQIESVLHVVASSVGLLKAGDAFTPWDINMEYDPETYINLGYIELNDSVAFRTIRDACNCFGHDYAGYQKAGARHPYEPDVMLWFPKLYPNDNWNNQIYLDENTIVERNLDEKKNRENIVRVMRNDNWQSAHNRIVFAKVRDNLGNTLYRFKGQYKLSINESVDSLVWKRTNTRVKTYPKKQ